MTHSGPFDDIKGKCHISKCVEDRSLWETSLYLKFEFGKLLGTLDMVTIMTPSRCRRARRIVLVWKEEQKQRLWIDNYLPRCGRGETLKNLMDQRIPCFPSVFHTVDH